MRKRSPNWDPRNRNLQTEGLRPPKRMKGCMAYTHTHILIIDNIASQKTNLRALLAGSNTVGKNHQKIFCVSLQMIPLNWQLSKIAMTQSVL